MAEPNDENSGSETDGEATRIASDYEFLRNGSRVRVIRAYDEVFAALKERSLAHEKHEVHDMREAVDRIAHRSIVDITLLCRKWVELDERGLTY
jgi:hypothetical protein